MAYPDLLYKDAQRFVADHPCCDFPQIVEVAANLSPEDFDRFVDDESFRRYGRLSKLPSALFSEMRRLTLQWAKQNPGECDPAVLSELGRVVVDDMPKPTQTLPHDAIRIISADRDPKSKPP
jgi:hypothetical protein